MSLRYMSSNIWVYWWSLWIILKNISYLLIVHLFVYSLALSIYPKFIYYFHYSLLYLLYYWLVSLVNRWSVGEFMLINYYNIINFITWVYFEHMLLWLSPYLMFDPLTINTYTLNWTWFLTRIYLFQALQVAVYLQFLLINYLQQLLMCCCNNHVNKNL